MNHFLKTRDEINSCTEYLKNNGLMSHPISCKDFDLANIIPRLEQGDILDMGSSGGSCILENAIKVGIKGRKVGIDLEYEFEVKVTPEGITYVKGDLMNTGFDAGSYQTVCCLSVIEHNVDFDDLATECGRLLKKGGKLFITFDYWPTPIDTKGLQLYGLDWNILDMEKVMNLEDAMWEAGLELATDIDWEVKDAVINDRYCAPFPNVAYTFGILEFIKQ